MVCKQVNNLAWQCRAAFAQLICFELSTSSTVFIVVHLFAGFSDASFFMDIMKNSCGRLSEALFWPDPSVWHDRRARRQVLEILAKLFTSIEGSFRQQFYTTELTARCPSFLMCRKDIADAVSTAHYRRDSAAWKICSRYLCRYGADFAWKSHACQIKTIFLKEITVFCRFGVIFIEGVSILDLFVGIDYAWASDPKEYRQRQLKLKRLYSWICRRGCFDTDA